MKFLMIVKDLIMVNLIEAKSAACDKIIDLYRL